MANLRSTPGPWYYVTGAVWSTPEGPDDGGECIAMRASASNIPPLSRDANMRICSAAQALLAVAEEIAADSRCDLVDSERRIRLYAAINKAGGELDADQHVQLAETSTRLPKGCPSKLYKGEHAYGKMRDIRYRATGEYREPKKGEYYLSGAIIQGWLAPNDYSPGNKYWIAVPVRVKRTVTETWEPL